MRCLHPCKLRPSHQLSYQLNYQLTYQVKYQLMERQPLGLQSWLIAWHPTLPQPEARLPAQPHLVRFVWASQRGVGR